MSTITMLERVAGSRRMTAQALLFGAIVALGPALPVYAAGGMSAPVAGLPRLPAPSSRSAYPATYPLPF